MPRSRLCPDVARAFPICAVDRAIDSRPVSARANESRGARSPRGQVALWRGTPVKQGKATRGFLVTSIPPPTPSPLRPSVYIDCAPTDGSERRNYPTHARRLREANRCRGTSLRHQIRAHHEKQKLRKH
eukprot:2556751-Pyramimonas_sp.AAC.1